MSMIRKIKRNISEAATGKRCNRFGSDRASSFKSYRREIATHLDNLFKIDEYLKHRTNRVRV